MAGRRKKASKKTASRRSRVSRHLPSPDVVVDETTGDADVVHKTRAIITRGTVDGEPDGIFRDDKWLDWYDEYIEALSSEGSHENAAKVVGKHVRTCQRHRKAHSGFSAACEEAWEHVVDALEASAMKRAIQGTLEPIMYRDQRVGAKRSFETALTIFMLKQNRMKYRQNIDDEGSEVSRLAINIRTVDGPNGKPKSIVEIEEDDQEAKK